MAEQVVYHRRRCMHIAHLPIALWALAALNNGVALQRVAHVIKHASDRQAVEAAE